MIKYLIFLLIISYILYKKKNYFLNNVSYLSKSDVEMFILKDKDMYIETMSPLDIYARIGKNNKKEYILKSVSTCRNLTMKQKLYLSDQCKIVDYWFEKQNMQELIDIPWKIAFTNGKVYEEGLPHTRCDIIFLSPKLFKYSDKKFQKLLIHEKYHIYQRYNKEKIKSKLENMGYFVYCHKSKFKNIRCNPDTDEFIYKEPDGITLIVYEYNSETPININDVKRYTKYEHPFEMLSYNLEDKYI